MSGSVVFYRFKAQKEPSTVQFEGTGISVWDLKKEILAENKLGKGADFDFAIYNSDTNEEYSDDKAIVPRSTSVIARRLPPSRPGRGNAQNYMASTLSAPGPSGTGPNAGRKGNMTQRFDVRNDAPPKASTPTPQPIIEATASTDADEASKIAAMFANTDEQWKTTQEKMSTATYYGFRGPRTGAPGGSKPPQHAAPDKPVPAGYVCYRCGQPGHWIQDCPTNSDPDYRNKPRIKRTTGIPKSFLQTVEGPAPDGENQAGLMVTADGNFVIARPDAASWEKHRAVTANLTSNDIQNAPPTDPDLTCPLCNRLLRDAVKTPCCSTSYCEECIHNYLSENDFVCPECESKVKSLKNLVKDEDRRERAKKYLEDTLQASKAAGEAEKAEKEKAEKADGKSDKGDDDVADATSKKTNPDEQKLPIIRTESLGPAEEGELAGDEAVSRFIASPFTYAKMS
ncbi:DWNN-domain-containing protein [Cystobasidium minutum MCA 4210]|uniref:DWNN-domain-containing protein n=1 Tax=Cystobasidium minutum MCA 4210 TaxID=1397322 RepID=UPI0034CDAED6|eukprot:jgi/Rhomi1/146125/e_gw1.6.577.1